MEIPVDVVICWVDGSDPRHEAKRSLHAPQTKGSGILKRRWEDNGELIFCLRSIEKYAPWVRRIWIVTDDQRPDLNGKLNSITLQKTSIVDHSAIFREHLDLLPTFNSVSIETMLWRIPELADRFIYFNDDFFLTAPLEPGDFFRGTMPRIRGKWTNWSKRTKWHAPGRHKLNGALLAGKTQDRMFSIGHVAYCLSRPMLERFFGERPDLLRENARHKYRADSQFSISSLSANLLADRPELIVGEQDWHEISVDVCAKGSPDEIAAAISRYRDPAIKFGCINDLRMAVERWPEARTSLAASIGVDAP